MTDLRVLHPTWRTWLRALCSLGLCLAATAHAAQAPITSLQRSLDAAFSQHALDIQGWQTEHGSQVLYVPNLRLPMFDLQVVVGGSFHDDGLTGLAQLTAGLIDKGSVSRSAAALALTLDDNAAQFGVVAGPQNTVFKVRGLSHTAQREAIVEVIADMLGNPAFAPDAMAKEKVRLLNLDKAREQSAAARATAQLFAHVFAGHPYAQTRAAHPETLQGITVEQVRDFHQRLYSAGNSVIVIVGNVTREEAHQMAAQISAALPPGPAAAAFAVPPASEPEIYHLEHPGTQTVLTVAVPSVPRRHPDNAALMLANEILGGSGINNRLMQELRTRRGLTYGAASQLRQMPQAGIWGLQLSVAPQYRDATLALVETLLQRYAEHGPTEQELDDAKRKLHGQMLRSSVSNVDIADQLRTLGFHQLPMSYYQTLLAELHAVTLDELKVVLKKHLDSHRLVQVSAGPSVEQRPLREPALVDAAP
ncbi:insulinase family protein [Pseudomonas sp. MAFF212428]|uniref:Insulinase family protein n=1 Tax=Pseudomonas brassicae TaxID=2708063 RepID=A0A6B3P196_9PSED|nr:pitrilysin family protein [Pseudomonas brassicae]NER60903.1 insulinase family protein [Pseudomonas brassicae]NER65677.1 insulinase family protein [Pseudomonas brassicae]